MERTKLGQVFNPTAQPEAAGTINQQDVGKQ